MNRIMEQIRSREELLDAIRQGKQPSYVFFWGHKPLANGEIGKPCFSQWWFANFSIDDVSYPTAEHYMMTEKARLFGDEETRKVDRIWGIGPSGSDELALDPAKWRGLNLLGFALMDVRQFISEGREAG